MVTLRPFKPDDLSALYAISLATGHEGGDSSHLYKDLRLIGHIYSAPYAVLRPGLVIVAVDEEGVGGFVAGAADTGSWEEALERSWWPKLRREYDDPSDRPQATWTADQRRASMIHRPERTPDAVAKAFPAHLHINLLARLQRRGIGSALLESWLGPAATPDAAAHVGVNCANLGAIRFWEARGFKALALDGPATDRTVWMGRSR